MDIELFRTSSEEERKKLRKILLDKQISFSERWEKIPLVKRGKYGGQKEMCVVYISEFYDDRVDEICKLMEKENA
ncbi:MAG: hypothetical protein IIY81_10085 [Lachnospiraceae bacterium]|jgi:hypothetical protein|nr:hypothetical protein [Lachnospiraceae bacterium]